MTALAAPLVAVRRLALTWHHAALAGVLALSAVLDLHKLSQNGYANTYYAGAVRSMLKSWHNFFFVSFDAGGLVSVDTPLREAIRAVSGKAQPRSDNGAFFCGNTVWGLETGRSEDALRSCDQGRQRGLAIGGAAVRA